MFLERNVINHTERVTAIEKLFEKIKKESMVIWCQRWFHFPKGQVKK
jgi:hypothetical protein